jgi:2-dehydro-3-deoxygalactonokinase
MADTALIALDWGTTALRAYHFARDGAVSAARELPAGVLRIAGGGDGFARAFDQACGDWLADAPAAPVIACGMVGSAQGWREAPYLDVPASVDDLARGLVAVDTGHGSGLDSPRGGVLHIVPGLIARGGLPEVMRGEETQIAGALAAAVPGRRDDDRDRWLALPGSHAKWVRVRERRIVELHTFLTGELFAALCEHSLLGRTMQRGATTDLAAFDRGVAAARAHDALGGVLSTVFSTRTLGLVGALPPTAQADYLSGLLIGHELAAVERLAGRPGPIALIGGDDLCRRYQRALAASGHPDTTILAGATERGLWAVARAAGLVSGAASAPASDSMSGAASDSMSGAASGLGGVRRAGLSSRRTAPRLIPLLERTGLIAILRGLPAGEAAAIGEALFAAGLRILEVPLGSPDALASIAALRRALPDECLIGAGTVMAPAEVAEVARAGGELIVMPHADRDVIRAARDAGLAAVPGVATPTEALAALAAGADALKLFPADAIGPAALAAWRDELPDGAADAAIVAVGGIAPGNLAAFAAAGATGAALGSSLYRPGMTAGEVAARAVAAVAAWRAARASR